MKLLEGLRLSPKYSIQDLEQAILEKLKVKVSDIDTYEIVKESIDARKKPNIFYNINVAVKLKKTNAYYNKLKDIVVNHDGIESEEINYSGKRPVVVGFGPAGMFVALKFARSGMRPIVIEQGDDVDTRRRKVDEFWSKGKLDVYSNVHFGEGGAGTFSDGKLNSNISNNYCKCVTNELINHGAPSEIFYRSKPHIGTDNLRHVVKNIREEILSLGGEVRFGNKLMDINIVNDGVQSIVINNIYTSQEEQIECDTLVLAIGHSAKPIFRLLQHKGVNMEQKPFAMGVRIEQLQEDINISQYGKEDCRLPAADYKLAEHLESGRSVFTFCMCPGGEVVASSSEEGTIVTNGMSYYSRDGRNANSAILVNVDPQDFGSSDVLAGFELQSEYERRAYSLGGGNYVAPAETIGSFLHNREVKAITHSYRPDIKLCNIRECLPQFVADSIKEALPKFNKKIKNFARDENLLIAIESRSSCPVRIIRDSVKYMTNITGLYAVGEGAGYAGGIMSSAQDGLKIAEKIVENYKQK
ncbi:MAG: hypothetical protein E7361_03345 [Clostridiales bacterium]|nr:hypothetical protein [Clostridiales bacterium]